MILSVKILYDVISITGKLLILYEKDCYFASMIEIFYRIIRYINN